MSLIMSFLSYCYKTVSNGRQKKPYFFHTCKPSNTFLEFVSVCLSLSCIFKVSEVFWEKNIKALVKNTKTTYDDLHLQWFIQCLLFQWYKLSQCPSNTDKFWLKLTKKDYDIWNHQLSKQTLPVAGCMQKENLVIRK